MKKLVYKLLAIVAVVLCSSATASALDLGAIELGKVYDIPDYSSVTGTITPETDGQLLQDGVPDLRLEGLESEFKGYGEYGQVNAWNVKAGVTYNVSCDFVFSGGKVMFYQETSGSFSLDIIEAYPQAGGVLSANANQTGELLVKFNAEVNYASAALCAGSESVPLVNNTPQSNTLTFGIADAMNTLYDSGALNTDGGDAVTLKLAGLQTAGGVLYGTDGVLELTYVSGAKLATLVSTNFVDGRQFKSFYPAGDPAAVLEFTFSANIAEGCVLAISVGDPEGLYIYEEVPCTVAGKVVTANLAGKLRDFTSVISDGDFVSVKLSNVRDTKGQFAQASSGNVGSFDYTFIYSYIPPVDVTAEFVPASGASLKGVNSIEIAFNHADAFTFGGVRFACDGEEVLVPASECNITVEDGWKTIVVAKPTAIEGKNAVTVDLYDLVCNDGFDHSAAIMAEYDTFVVTLLSPYKQGDAIATTGDEDWVITCNADPGYMRYDFYSKPTVDSADGWVYGSYFNKQDDGTWTAYNGNYTCYADYEPYMIVRAYNEEADYWQNPESAIGEYKITFVGTTAPFSYSTVKFVGIDPENQSTIFAPVDDNFCFTVTYDGLVTIDPNLTGINMGWGMRTGFAKVEPYGLSEEDNPEYSNIWKLYPDPEFVNSNTTMEIFIAAFDEQGKRVEGNMGAEEGDYLSLEYIIDNPFVLADLVVMPWPDSTVPQLDVFNVSVLGQAVTRNLNYEGDMPMIVNKLQEVVYVFSDEDITIENEFTGEYDEMGEPIMSEISTVNLTVNPAITEDGSYMLIIPAHFFIVGDQFNTQDSNEFYGFYTIGAGGGDVEPKILTVNPAGGDVNELKRIDFDAPGIEDAMCNGIEDVVIYDANDNVVFSETTFDISMGSFDWDTFSFVGFYIEPDITEAGVYLLYVPAATFEFADMSYNEELWVVYNVMGESGISSMVVEKAGSYRVYNMQGVKVLDTDNAADLGRLPRGIYIVNGKKVMMK